MKGVLLTNLVGAWFACISVLASGCVYTYTASAARYTIRLAAVERPADAKERYGEQVIQKRSGEGDSLKYWFEDQMVSILWVPTTTRVHFLLTNKTGHSIKIIWDEAAFVMPSGESRRVVHSGVKYTDASSSHPPSVIARNGVLADFILSSDQCRYGIYYPAELKPEGSRRSNWDVGYIETGWYESPFLPRTPDATSQADLKGKLFSILLPLQIEGVTNEYTFTFSIDDIAPPAVTR